MKMFSEVLYTTTSFADVGEDLEESKYYEIITAIDEETPIYDEDDKKECFGQVCECAQIKKCCSILTEHDYYKALNDPSGSSFKKVWYRFSFRLLISIKILISACMGLLDIILDILVSIDFWKTSSHMYFFFSLVIFFLVNLFGTVIGLAILLTEKEAQKLRVDTWQIGTLCFLSVLFALPMWWIPLIDSLKSFQRIWFPFARVNRRLNDFAMNKMHSFRVLRKDDTAIPMARFISRDYPKENEDYAEFLRSTDKKDLDMNDNYYFNMHLTYMKKILTKQIGNSGFWLAMWRLFEAAGESILQLLLQSYVASWEWAQGKQISLIQILSIISSLFLISYSLMGSFIDEKDALQRQVLGILYFFLMLTARFSAFILSFLQFGFWSILIPLVILFIRAVLVCNMFKMDYDKILEHVHNQLPEIPEIHRVHTFRSGLLLYADAILSSCCACLLPIFPFLGLPVLTTKQSQFHPLQKRTGRKMFIINCFENIILTCILLLVPNKNNRIQVNPKILVLILFPMAFGGFVLLFLTSTKVIPRDVPFNLQLFHAEYGADLLSQGKDKYAHQQFRFGGLKRGIQSLIEILSNKFDDMTPHLQVKSADSLKNISISLAGIENLNWVNADFFSLVSKISANAQVKRSAAIIYGNLAQYTQFSNIFYFDKNRDLNSTSIDSLIEQIKDQSAEPFKKDSLKQALFALQNLLYHIENTAEIVCKYDILSQIIGLVRTSKSKKIQEYALRTLTNLAANNSDIAPDIARQIVQADIDIIPLCQGLFKNQDAQIKKAAIYTLTNLANDKDTLQNISENIRFFDTVIHLITQENADTTRALFMLLRKMVSFNEDETCINIQPLLDNFSEEELLIQTLAILCINRGIRQRILQVNGTIRAFISVAIHSKSEDTRNDVLKALKLLVLPENASLMREQSNIDVDIDVVIDSLVKILTYDENKSLRAVYILGVLSHSPWLRSRVLANLVAKDKKSSFAQVGGKIDTLFIHLKKLLSFANTVDENHVGADALANLATLYDGDFVDIYSVINPLLALISQHNTPDYVKEAAFRAIENLFKTNESQQIIAQSALKQGVIDSLVQFLQSNHRLDLKETVAHVLTKFIQNNEEIQIYLGKKEGIIQAALSLLKNKETTTKIKKSMLLALQYFGQHQSNQSIIKKNASEIVDVIKELENDDELTATATKTMKALYPSASRLPPPASSGPFHFTSIVDRRI